MDIGFLIWEGMRKTVRGSPLGPWLGGGLLWKVTSRTVQISEIFLVSLGSNTAGRFQFNKIFNLVSCAVKYDLHLEHLEDKQRELFLNPSYPLRVTGI